MHAYDQNYYRYFFIGADSLENMYLYIINAVSGQVKYNPSFDLSADTSGNIIEISYDNSSNQLFALHWDYSTYREYLVTITMDSGEVTLIDSIPGVRGISFMPNLTVLDELNRHFLFLGYDSLENGFLYTLDLASGEMVGKTPYPDYYNYPDYLTNLQCDNETGAYYALYWDNHVVDLESNTSEAGSGFTVFPNPVTSCFEVLPKVECNIALVRIFNLYGMELHSFSSDKASRLRFLRDNIPPGLYFISVVADGQNLGTQKILFH